MDPEEKLQKREEAKNTLREMGYAVDNLWHIANDVQSKFKCTDAQAYQILNNVLKSEYLTVEINFAIAMEAESEDLEEIEEV